MGRAGGFSLLLTRFLIKYAESSLQGQTIVGIESTTLLHSKVSDSKAVASYPPGYLDILPDSAGYNHLAYYSPPESKTPVFLTSGSWEIDGTIEAVDVSRGLV